MNSSRPAWRLEKVRVVDLLGFQGAQEFTFDAGLQVIEAPNHTGKTSLTMGLLWGLTGVIPNLARINKQSFRLTNKHVGENAQPAVTTFLMHDDGRRLRIHRRYQPRPDIDTDLTVDLDDKTFTGQQAQDWVFAELGMKPESLEGCGVVLQDQRLGLITGKASDISDVINDVLGLYTLSQLVPALEVASKAANELKRDIQNYIEVANPVLKWEERNSQLLEEFRQLENKAIEAGFSQDALDDPKASALEELASVARTLGATAPEIGAEVSSEVERLRACLSASRKASPVSGEIATLQARKDRLVQWGKTARSLEEALTAHDLRLLTESANGEMDLVKLATTIAEKEAAMEQNAGTRKQLQEEEGFLSACYDHLLIHQDGESCPLCLNGIEAKKLLSDVKNRLAGKIAIGLERLQKEDKSLAEQKKATDKRFKLIKGLRDEHQELVEKMSAFKEQIDQGGLTWSAEVEADELYFDATSRRKLLAALRETLVTLNQEEASAGSNLMQKQDAQAKQEAEFFQPAESRINRTRDHFVGIIAAANRLQTHGNLRQKAEEQKTCLESLLDETSKVAGQIKKISGALSEHEEAAATGAIKAQLPQISELFRKIAGNPDYDALSIQPTINRDKVTYKIQATSSQIGNLNDAVGHVLSEGDLSSAGMALLLGLAAGQAHRMGFLVLDDPAQGMDDTLQANFAMALAKLEGKKQVIILTHQRSFAEALKNAGAAHSQLAGWKSGRIQ